VVLRKWKTGASGSKEVVPVAETLILATSRGIAAAQLPGRMRAGGGAVRTVAVLGTTFGF
jgi:hypothetical protein